MVCACERATIMYIWCMCILVTSCKICLSPCFFVWATNVGGASSLVSWIFLATMLNTTCSRLPYSSDTFSIDIEDTVIASSILYSTLAVSVMNPAKKINNDNNNNIYRLKREGQAYAPKYLKHFLPFFAHNLDFSQILPKTFLASITRPLILYFRIHPWINTNIYWPRISFFLSVHCHIVIPRIKKNITMKLYH